MTTETKQNMLGLCAFLILLLGGSVVELAMWGMGQ